MNAMFLVIYVLIFREQILKLMEKVMTHFLTEHLESF